MQIREFFQTKEKTFIRLVLLVLFISVGSFLFYEQCTPLALVFMKVWGFANKVIAGLWGGLEWPHAVLIMFLLLVLNFKSEISRLMARLKKVGDWADFLEQEQSEQSQQLVIPQAVAVGDVLQVAQQNAILQTEFPTQFPLALNAVMSELQHVAEADKISYLVNNLTYTRVYQEFENIYSYIFGGQIKVLGVLNQRAPGGVPFSELDALWSDIQKAWAPAYDKQSIEQYSNWLNLRNLSETVDGALHITAKGREFLTWMTRTGRANDKFM